MTLLNAPSSNSEGGFFKGAKDMAANFAAAAGLGFVTPIPTLMIGALAYGGMQLLGASAGFSFFGAAVASVMAASVTIGLPLMLGILGGTAAVALADAFDIELKPVSLIAGGLTGLAAVGSIFWNIASNAEEINPAPVEDNQTSMVHELSTEEIAHYQAPQQKLTFTA